MLLRKLKDIILETNSFKDKKLFLALIFLLGSNFNAGVCFNPEDYITERNSKLKVKINYIETPNPSDFYNTKKLDKFLTISNKERLQGNWLGEFNLDDNSIYWVNPGVDKNKIYESIDRGPYEVTYNFDFTEQGILSKLRIIQDLVKYSSINIELQSEKQINYWAKAKINNWLQVIRGKIIMFKEDKLFTIFQTTVYEDGTPIYAFRGKTILNKEKTVNKLTVN